MNEYVYVVLDNMELDSVWKSDKDAQEYVDQMNAQRAPQFFDLSKRFVMIQEKLN